MTPSRAKTHSELTFPRSQTSMLNPPAGRGRTTWTTPRRSSATQQPSLRSSGRADARIFWTPASDASTPPVRILLQAKVLLAAAFTSVDVSAQSGCPADLARSHCSLVLKRHPVPDRALVARDPDDILDYAGFLKQLAPIRVYIPLIIREDIEDEVGRPGEVLVVDGLTLHVLAAADRCDQGCVIRMSSFSWTGT